jgi:hypothetical protein
MKQKLILLETGKKCQVCTNPLFKTEIIDDKSKGLGYHDFFESQTKNLHQSPSELEKKEGHPPGYKHLHETPIVEREFGDIPTHNDKDLRSPGGGILQPQTSSGEDSGEEKKAIELKNPLFICLHCKKACPQGEDMLHF